MLILIIDDSVVFRYRLLEILSDKWKSKNFLEANNIHEAKDILHDFLPDIIITDIRMPGGSGFELIKEIRTKNKITTIAVITNYSEGQYKTEALRAGADYFFSKSNDIEKLSNIIDSLSPYKTEVINA